MDYTVKIPLTVGITAGNEEDGNVELAQKRAERVEAVIVKAAVAALRNLRADWLGGLDSEGMEVEEV